MEKYLTILSLLLFGIFSIINAADLDYQFLNQDVSNLGIDDVESIITPYQTTSEPKTLIGNPSDMIIITNQLLYAKFCEFAAIKNKEGIKTTVVSTSTIGSSPETIRTYLQTQKQLNPDLRYVILGGDASVIMPRMLLVETTNYNWDEYPNDWGWKMPTDFYYSNVLSTWTDDLNSLNYTPDLYVGRIPADTVQEVQNFITKYINYRYNTNQNFVKTNKFMSNNLARVPGNTLSDRIVNGISSIIPNSYKSLMLENQIYAPVVQSVSDTLNAGTYHFLYATTHGTRGGVFGAYNIDCEYPAYIDSTFTGTCGSIVLDQSLTIYGLPADPPSRPYAVPPSHYRYLPYVLTNTQAKPYVLWMSSCDGNQFAVMSTSSPTSYIPQQCIGAEFMNNNDGAVAVYANAYHEIPGFTKFAGQKYFTNIYTQGINKLGYLTGTCWSDYNLQQIPSDYQEMVLGYILFGDPSMDVWSSLYSTFSVVKNVSGTAYTFYVKNVGKSIPAVGVLCSILNPNGSVFGRFYTDEDGKFKVNLPISISNTVLGVCEANFIPYNQLVTNIPLCKQTSKDDKIADANLDFKCYPNPLNPNTTFSFELKYDSNAKLTIYNIKGQQVAQIVNGSLDAGKHTYTWNSIDNSGNSIASGIYWCRLETQSGIVVRKIVISK